VNILAIDQGTSSTTALVLGPDDDVLGSARAPLTTRASPDGAVEQDPIALLDSIIIAGRAALLQAGVRVAAVGLGNQGETVLRWDRASGEPLGNAIGWQDRRAVSVTRELAERSGRLVELSGLPLDPYFAAPKMAWLQREGGDTGAITTIDAWVTHRLTGAFVTAQRPPPARCCSISSASSGWPINLLPDATPVPPCESSLPARGVGVPCRGTFRRCPSSWPSRAR